MLFETFRTLFDRLPGDPRRARRLLDWLVTFAIMAGGALLLRDAMIGRGYPWSQGKVFFGAVLLWVAAIRARNGIARIVRGRETGDALGWVVARLNRALILALVWFPGLAVGWYSIEAANRPSRNSRGQDICDVSSAQFCVSGPRALIPWAILLLVFSGFATWFFLRSWGSARRRDPEPPRTAAQAARARVERVIPADEAGAPGPVEAPAATYNPRERLRPVDPDFDDGMARLSELVRMKQGGFISDEEFQQLKREIVLKVTDGA